MPTTTTRINLHTRALWLRSSPSWIHLREFSDVYGLKKVLASLHMRILVRACVVRICDKAFFSHCPSFLIAQLYCEKDWYLGQQARHQSSSCHKHVSGKIISLACYINDTKQKERPMPYGFDKAPDQAHSYRLSRVFFSRLQNHCKGFISLCERTTDHGLPCPFTKSRNIGEYIDEQSRPWSDCANSHVDRTSNRTVCDMVYNRTVCDMRGNRTVYDMVYYRTVWHGVYSHCV